MSADNKTQTLHKIRVKTGHTAHIEDSGKIQGSVVVERTEHTSTNSRARRILTGKDVVVEVTEHTSTNSRAGRILTGKDIARAKIRKKLRDGLPVLCIRRVQEAVGFSDPKDILPILGMSARTYARRKKENKPLTAVESDRLFRIANVEALSERVFGDKETARDWLKTYNRALKEIPLNLLDTEIGVDQIERVLMRIEHGVYS